MRRGDNIPTVADYAHHGEEAQAVWYAENRDDMEHADEILDEPDDDFDDLDDDDDEGDKGPGPVPDEDVDWDGGPADIDDEGNVT